MNIFPQLKRTPLKRSKKRIAKKSKRPSKGMTYKLDSAFGKMIMARDYQLLCISCKKVPGTQPGHFMRRGLQATRWHPQNVHSQCFQCNCVEASNPFEYYKAIDEKYGEGTAERLKLLARTSYKPGREALEALLATAKVGHEAYQETWEFYGSEK